MLEVGYPDMDPIRLARWSTALAIIIAAAALLIGLMLVAVSQTPSLRNKVRCQSNMIAISEALRRYSWPNDGYPDSLESLRKEYLKDAGVLRCPLDKNPAGKPSYIYIKPEMDSSDDMVVLGCDRHRNILRERVLLVVTKDGKPETIQADPVTNALPVLTTPKKQRRLQPGDAAESLPRKQPRY
jgi:hypothetical protein